MSVQKWDEIYRNRYDLPLIAATVLAEHTLLLPKNGSALDLACGLGANALLLAECGLDVHAWDISSVALVKLLQTAQKKDFKITTRQVDIQVSEFCENSFDIIVVSRFLDRSLSDAIMTALKPQGLLFYQTYTKQKISDTPPHNPDFLLTENELLKMFAPLKVIFYQEYGRIGDLNYGERNEALFIGQKS